MLITFSVLLAIVALYWTFKSNKPKVKGFKEKKSTAANRNKKMDDEEGDDDDEESVTAETGHRARAS